MDAPTLHRRVDIRCIHFVTCKLERPIALQLHVRSLRSSVVEALAADFVPQVVESAWATRLEATLGSESFAAGLHQLLQMQRQTQTSASVVQLGSAIPSAAAIHARLASFRLCFVQALRTRFVLLPDRGDVTADGDSTRIFVDTASQTILVARASEDWQVTLLVPFATLSTTSTPPFATLSTMSTPPFATLSTMSTSDPYVRVWHRGAMPSEGWPAGPLDARFVGEHDS
jgi:hypothetical protein